MNMENESAKVSEAPVIPGNLTRTAIVMPLLEMDVLTRSVSEGLRAVGLKHGSAERDEVDRQKELYSEINPPNGVVRRLSNELPE
jgi:hypothetical protein